MIALNLIVEREIFYGAVELGVVFYWYGKVWAVRLLHFWSSFYFALLSGRIWEVGSVRLDFVGAWCDEATLLG
jgi:hypothetical protein